MFVVGWLGIALGGPSLGAAREDPAQDQLRLVIAGLVGLAVVLVVLQVVLWRVTSPKRRARRDAAEAAEATAVAAAEPERATEPEQLDLTAPAAPPAPAVARIPLGASDAPWPPPRVAHRGSARPPRPPDAPGSVFARLAGVPDLDVAPIVGHDAPEEALS